MKRATELADIDPVQAVALGGGEIERSDPLQADFAVLALYARERHEPGFKGERAAGVAALQADEELMPAQRRIGDGQHETAGVGVAALERSAGDRGQLVVTRQADVERARLTLQHRNVDERHHPDIGFRDRHQRQHVGKRARLARGGDRRAVAHRPPHFGRRARNERRVDQCPSAGR